MPLGAYLANLMEIAVPNVADSAQNCPIKKNLPICRHGRAGVPAQHVADAARCLHGRPGACLGRHRCVNHGRLG